MLEVGLCPLTPNKPTHFLPTLFEDVLSFGLITHVVSKEEFRPGLGNGVDACKQRYTIRVRLGVKLFCLQTTFEHIATDSDRIAHTKLSIFFVILE